MGNRVGGTNKNFFGNPLQCLNVPKWAEIFTRDIFFASQKHISSYLVNDLRRTHNFLRVQLNRKLCRTGNVRRNDANARADIVRPSAVRFRPRPATAAVAMPRSAFPSDFLVPESQFRSNLRRGRSRRQETRTTLTGMNQVIDHKLITNHLCFSPLKCPQQRSHLTILSAWRIRSVLIKRKLGYSSWPGL